MNNQAQLDFIAMLAKVLNVSVRNINHRDPNVFWREKATSTASTELLAFRKCIRFKSNDLKAEIRSNDIYVVLQVRAEILSGTWSVNARDQIMQTRELSESVCSLPLFASPDGLTPKAREITIKQSFSDLLQELHLGSCESLHFYDNALLYYARLSDGAGFLNRTHSICQFVASISKMTQTVQSVHLPASFEDLRLVAQRWAINDDMEREEAVEEASPEELKMLVNQVGLRLPSISAHLDAHEGEMEASLTSLAQSAIEARLALEALGQV